LIIAVTSSIDAEGILSVCPRCGQKNRTPFTHVGQRGRCGTCKAPLPALSSPIEIDTQAHFEALVANCSVPVLVDFWAPWCTPCRTVAPEMEKVAVAETGRLLVVKVNTENLPGLSRRFEIHSIPTMMVFLHGKEMGGAAGARGRLQPFGSSSRKLLKREGTFDYGYDVSAMTLSAPCRNK
jgi:thioredoxin 2